MNAKSVGALGNLRSSKGENRHSVPTEKSDVIPSEVRHEIVIKTIAAGESDLDKASLEELQAYSRAILYCVIYGYNSEGEKRLLWEIYWHTIDMMSHLRNGQSV